MMLDDKKEWIDFKEQPQTGKTKVFNIVPKEQPNSIIGVIKWYGAWRKYCFFTMPNCIFETNCLSNINAFLHKLNTEWKVQQQQKKQSKT